MKGNDKRGKTSNSNIKVFENPEFGSISIIEIDSEWMFELYAVGAALGYVRSNGKSKGEHGVHPENEKLFPYKSRIDKVAENAEIKPCVYYGNKYITESQVYDLMLEARTDKCRAFRKWVTSEVLPSIRKTGSYITEGSNMRQYITQLHKTVTDLSLKLIEIDKTLRVLVAKQQIDMKTVDIWKKYVAIPKMQTLSANSGIDIKECYKMVYNVMMENYGFCESVAVNDFLVNYECDNISMINIIAIDKTYRQWFIQSVDTLLNGIASVTPKLTIQTNHNDKLNGFASGCISVDDDYDEIVDYIAGLIGDYTKLKIKTKKYIFKMITSERGWKSLLTRNKCVTKKALITSNIKYKKKFVKVCNEIVNHCKYNK